MVDEYWRKWDEGELSIYVCLCWRFHFKAEKETYNLIPWTTYIGHEIQVTICHVYVYVRLIDRTLVYGKLYLEIHK